MIFRILLPILFGLFSIPKLNAELLESRLWKMSQPTSKLDAVEEWALIPYRCFGADYETEFAISSTIQQAWTSKGLRLRIICYRASVLSNDLIDIFVDSRPRNTNLFAYDEHVNHLQIEPLAGRKFFRVSSGKKLPEPLLNDDCRILSKVRSGGWEATIEIPWRCLGIDEIGVNDWIGFSVRIQCKDPASQRLFESGDLSPDRSNTLETTPMAFNVVQLVGKTQRAHFTEISEVNYGGRHHVKFKFVVPADSFDLLNKTIHFAGDFMSPICLKFHRSAGGHFWVAQEFVVIEKIKEANNPDQKVAIDIGSSEKWAQTFSIPVWTWLNRIECALPASSFETLDTRTNNLVRLLKECAEESAWQITQGDQDERPPGKRYRSLFNASIYDEQINILIGKAIEIVKRGADLKSFPIVPIESTIDGTILPAVITFPWNYTIGQQYPIEVVLLGYNSHRRKSDLVEPVIRSTISGQLEPFYGSCFRIILYERSQDDLDLEREWLNSALWKVSSILPNWDRRFWIAGVSAGARRAMACAIRHPGLFSHISLTSGDYDTIPELKTTESTDPLTNLFGATVCLYAGETDPGPLASSRGIERRLSYLGVSHSLTVISGTGHHFRPPPPQKEVPAVKPLGTSITCYDPDFAIANSGSIEKIRLWNTPAVLFYKAQASRIDVSTKNIAQFKLVDADQLVKGAEIYINGYPLLAPTFLKAPLSLRSFDGEHFVIQNSEPSDGKRPGSCGPAWKLEEQPVVIVFGTKETAQDLCRARAQRILEERVGFGATKLATHSFQIISDREAQFTDLTNKNLWLIGSKAENILVEKLNDASRLPDMSSVLSSTAPTLVSYIYPGSKSGNYIYHELANDSKAYGLGFWRAPKSDISIQTINSVFSTAEATANFDTQWKLPDDFY